jgi:glucose-1-phosphate adenylyltransferase
MRGVVTVLLAGGVGSRLSILVRSRAKPAVPFGGTYRIIDFTLSNIANSGITKVAVLTQYKPLSLMDHIGDGSAWDLAGRSRGVKILPPKTGEKDWDWYKGTADAVRQNIDFISSAQYTEVLVLSGDHVYCMDYGPLVDFHRNHEARVTVGMITVPWEETRHFGVGVVDEEGRIISWEEKPKKAPRSNLASMGIYVFDRAYLVEALASTSEEDFGKHIIPKALAEGGVFGYPFGDYWRDVGTLQAYWDANMDLLTEDSGLSLGMCTVKTNLSADTIPYDRPPCTISGRSMVANSLISPDCRIRGMVENSLLSPGVVVEEGAEVRDSIVMHDAFIGRGTRLSRCVIDKEVVVGQDAIIGYGNPEKANRNNPDHLYSGLTIIGKGAVIPPRVSVGTNCIIHPSVREQDFRKSAVADGENVGK